MTRPQPTPSATEVREGDAARPATSGGYGAKAPTNDAQSGPDPGAAAPSASGARPEDPAPETDRAPAAHGAHEEPTGGRGAARREHLYHRVAAVITMALLALLVWDDLANSGRLFVPLLIITLAHLLIQMTVLLWLRPEVEARIHHELVHMVEFIEGGHHDPDRHPATAKVAVRASAEPTPVAPVAHGSTPAKQPFRFRGFHLYQTETVDKGGNARTFYFFSKRTPRSGVPATKPDGTYVGVNASTGLPFLKRGTGTDGALLHPEEKRREQCYALTRAGAQCRNNARQNSRYCIRHAGYHPPSREKAATAVDTRPRSRRSVDTAPSSRRG